MISQTLAQLSNIIMCFSVLLIPLAFFRVRYNFVDNRYTARTILDNLTESKYAFALNRSNDKLTGYSICLKPFALLLLTEDSQNDYHSVKLVCTDASFKILTTNKIITNNTIIEDNTVWSKDEMKYIDHERTGSTYHCTYAKINSVININPTKSQEYISQRIMDRFTSHQSVVAFISGPICTGKSSIAHIIVGLLNKTQKYESVNLCNTFCPLRIGDCVSTLLGNIRLQTNPLILVIDEIDTILTKIHQGVPEVASNGLRPMNDKMSWNIFMDKLSIRAGVIVLLTSNKSLAEIETTCDPSYLRNGRVHMAFEMPNDITQICIEPRKYYTSNDISAATNSSNITKMTEKTNNVVKTLSKRNTSSNKKKSK
jgi:hypothetical protein